MLEDVDIQIILRLKWSDSLQQASTAHLIRFGHPANHRLPLAKYLCRGRTRSRGKHKESLSVAPEGPRSVQRRVDLYRLDFILLDG